MKKLRHKIFAAFPKVSWLGSDRDKIKINPDLELSPGHFATSLLLWKMLSVSEKRMRVFMKSMWYCDVIFYETALMLSGFTTYFVLFA